MLSCRFFSARILAGLLFTLAAPLAAAPRWTPLGPFGGSVRTLTVDPTNARVVYATLGTQGGYKSVDSGISWMPLFAGGTASNVALDPVHPKVLYLVTYRGGLLKSVDGGAHWTSAGQGLSILLPTVLAVDPVRPSRLYAATYRRVWRSVNGGASWQPPPQMLPEGEAGRITALVASRPAGTAFVGTGAGLFKSADGGLSWKPVGPDLPAGTVQALAVALSDPRTIYVSLTKEGLFRSSDGGTHWQAVPRPSLQPGVVGLVSSLSVSPRSARTVYAGTLNTGLFRSTDGGAHWSTRGPRATADVTAVATSPASPFTVYTALTPEGLDAGGVFASDDGGASWQRRNRGLAGLEVVTFQVDPAHPGVLWAGLTNQVFRSGNAGLRWVRPPLPVPNSDTLQVHHVALAPVDPSTVYVLATPWLWRTTDGGASWTELRNPSSTSPYLGLLWVDPASPSKLWGAEAGNRLYQSTDGGVTWTQQPAPVPGCWFFDLAFAPSSPSTIYVSGADLGAIGCKIPKLAFFRSTDGGATWTKTDTGPPVPSDAIAVDPVDPRLVYLATVDGVWKSADGGATWARAGEGLKRKFVTGLAASSLAGVLWAGTSDGRVFRSGNGGATWEDRSAGLQTPYVSGLTVDAANPRKVYAFTWTGVWVLEDDTP